MRICGLDEAGRGPIAGPVVAAAVILSEDLPVEVLDDSKKLSPAARERAETLVKREAIAWGIGWAWPEEIDRINILRASLLAMKRAFDELRMAPDRAVADGIHVPELPCPTEAVVRADTTVPCVQAASILAKTARDRWMMRYALIEPVYGFERHKGYPTAEHLRLVREHGVSRIHRYSFRVEGLSVRTPEFSSPAEPLRRKAGSS